METRKKLKAEAINAEERATCHFRKLQTIENILTRSEIDKTPAVFIVDKIKEVISNHTK